MRFEYQTIWRSDNFRPFEYQTSPAFRSPLYSNHHPSQARNVQYVDTAEEEWGRFQKEIGDELNVAQDILVEDRNEATIDRQIEEIDEQMRAWSR